MTTDTLGLTLIASGIFGFAVMLGYEAVKGSIWPCKGPGDDMVLMGPVNGQEAQRGPEGPERGEGK